MNYQPISTGATARFLVAIKTVSWKRKVLMKLQDEKIVPKKKWSYCQVDMLIPLKPSGRLKQPWEIHSVGNFLDMLVYLSAAYNCNWRVNQPPPPPTRPLRHRWIASTSNQPTTLAHSGRHGVMGGFWRSLVGSRGSSWWLNKPIWKICSSNWKSSPILGVRLNENIWETTTQGWYRGSSWG